MADPVPVLALLGGDAALRRELADAVDAAGSVALLPPSSQGRATVLLVADDPEAAALDRVRVEAALRPDRPVLVVGGAGDAAAAMACGARGLVARPLSGRALLDALGAAGCLDAPAAGGFAPPAHLVVLLGATGGAGTTTCAVALGVASTRGLVVDLDLAAGDAAEVAAARVEAPDAMLALAGGTGLSADALHAHLAAADGVAVLPAPALPEHADLVEEGAVGRLLDLAGASGFQIVVDGGPRICLETVPALERAAVILLVTSADRRGRDGAQRLLGLLFRLGLAERRLGLVCQAPRRGHPREPDALAGALGIPLVGTIGASRAVARARERGEAVPAAPFAGVAGGVLSLVPA